MQNINVTLSCSGSVLMIITLIEIEDESGDDCWSPIHSRAATDGVCVCFWRESVRPKRGSQHLSVVSTPETRCLVIGCADLF